jgi:regulator of cell morphogenesis and NO signaling
MSAYSRVPTTDANKCVSYKTPYKTLSEFEADLHEHIRLENNILFPRAIALENTN